MSGTGRDGTSKAVGVAGRLGQEVMPESSKWNIYIYGNIGDEQRFFFFFLEESNDRI